MLIFFLICAAMTALALWFVVPPLLQKKESSAQNPRANNVEVYRDQYQELEADLRNGLTTEEQFQQDKEELERRLLEDVTGAKKIESSGSPPLNRKLVYGILAAIPIVALSLYARVGNPKALNPQTAAPPVDQSSGPMTQAQIEANVAKLAQRLKENPNDVPGWTMLSRSLMSMERYAEAATAFEHLTSLSPNDAEAWADYAEALAMANGHKMAGKPLDAANHALQLDAKNKQALVLMATAAFEAHDYQKSIEYWQKLLPLLPQDSEAAKTVTDQINKSKELAAGRPSR
jgi:cytochrome c-type biogenesis protein CcmH